MNVRVDSDPGRLLPGDVHAEVGHLGANPGELAKVFDVVGDVAIVVSLKDKGGLLEVDGLALQTRTRML